MAGSQVADSHGSLQLASSLVEVIDQSLRMASEITSLCEVFDVVVMASDDHEERAMMREAHRRDVLKDDMTLFYQELIKVQTSSSHLKLEGDIDQGRRLYVCSDVGKEEFAPLLETKNPCS